MSKPALNLSAVIQHLTTSWGDGVTHQRVWYPQIAGIPPTVTFSIGFGATSSAGGENSGLVAMTATERSSAAYAFSLWQDLIPVDLVQIASSSADITLNLSASANDGSSPLGKSSYTHPDLRTLSGQPDQIFGEQIWIGAQFGEIFDPKTNKLVTPTDDAYYFLGSYSILNMVHEIGHALGLSHPDTYDVSNGQKLGYNNNATYSGDFRQYSIMSYFGAYKTGVGWTTADDFNGKVGTDLYPQTPMRDDILAIQSLYGENHNTRSGNTHYGFNADPALKSTVYDFSYNRTPILTIWDGGGGDTLDLSGSSARQVIDLNPGAYSSVMRLTDNVAIAYNCIIENAIAGSGSNTIIGNAFANLIVGGAGKDLLEGRGGNDIIELRAARLNASDKIAGGSGADELLLTSAGTITVGGVDGIETYVLAGGRANSLVLTDANFTSVNGRVITVDCGNAGNAVSAAAVSRTNRVVIAGGSGKDVLDGGAGNDIFRFSAAGLTAADTIKGGLGNDALVLTGAGTVGAGGVSGVETFTLATRGANSLTLGAANFAAVAGAQITVSDGNGGDNVYAARLPRADRILVHAGKGRDRLTGGAGDDTFFAGGDTKMTGKGGANKFVFAATGSNTITDFAASVANEIVFVSGAGFALPGAGKTAK
ncbi:MAG: M10 family metallopeptidase, partial [Stellaceae bacterium]